MTGASAADDVAYSLDSIAGPNDALRSQTRWKALAEPPTAPTSVAGADDARRLEGRLEGAGRAADGLDLDRRGGWCVGEGGGLAGIRRGADGLGGSIGGMTMQAERDAAWQGMGRGADGLGLDRRGGDAGRARCGLAGMRRGAEALGLAETAWKSLTGSASIGGAMMHSAGEADREARSGALTASTSIGGAMMRSAGEADREAQSGSLTASASIGGRG